MATEITQETDVRRALETARTIAVLGAHQDPQKPAYYVPEYLHGAGYRILPVNPMLRGKSLFGEVVRATLAEIGEQVDIVDVFRRPELLAAHLPDLLAMAPRPGLVWLQQGIRNDGFARSVIEAGIDVVQDRCTLADHRRFGLGRVG
jgi:uncharacterized protein